MDCIKSTFLSHKPHSNPFVIFSSGARATNIQLQTQPYTIEADAGHAGPGSKDMWSNQDKVLIAARHGGEVKRPRMILFYH